MEDQIDVPSFFLCPISLQLMKDPVTVQTGITYDRESIERWLFSGKNNICPVTKQIISTTDCDIMPNHTLRRLIQSWCTLNTSYGIERIPTPKPPVNKAQIAKLISDAKSPQQQIKCLRKLRLIAGENDTNKRCMEAAGAVEFLASVVSKFNSLSFLESSDDDGLEITRPSDEALSILYGLPLSEPALKNLAGKNGEFVQSLTRVMQCGSYESRTFAVLLLKSILEVADPMQLINLRSDLFVEIVQVLRDRSSQQASKAALQLLINLCPWGRNRIKAIEANAVWVLVDLLLDSPERRPCEMSLLVLDTLCQCAEGRAKLLGHGAGLAVVSKKILRVSQVASESAVRILSSISKFSATASVLQEMLQIGVVAKLCLVVQIMDSSNKKTKEKAREMLKLHARAWKNSPCVPVNLLVGYPA